MLYRTLTVDSIQQHGKYRKLNFVIICSLFAEIQFFYFIFRSRQYFLLYPQYQIDVPHQSINDYAAIAGNKQFLAKVIPPPIETIKPEKEPEKHGTNDKEITIKDELQPTKPFYYVLPPESQILYYNPQIQTAY